MKFIYLPSAQVFTISRTKAKIGKCSRVIRSLNQCYKLQLLRYIRFIYNRVLLECATVRAAAVSALARFGALCDDLLPNILVLLSRCQMDADDEVSLKFRVQISKQREKEYLIKIFRFSKLSVKL